MRKALEIGILAAAMGMMAMGGTAATAAAARAKPKMLNGTWGGDRMNLTMTASGGTIRMDCASGTIKGRVIPDAKGKFTASGTFDQQRGGATLAKDFAAGGRPATFVGQVTGETIRLSVRQDDGSPAQDYVLIRGKTERLVRCL